MEVKVPGTNVTVTVKIRFSHTETKKEGSTVIHTHFYKATIE